MGGHGKAYTKMSSARDIFKNEGRRSRTPDVFIIYGRRRRCQGTPMTFSRQGQILRYLVQVEKKALILGTSSKIHMSSKTSYHRRPYPFLTPVDRKCLALAFTIPKMRVYEGQRKKLFVGIAQNWLIVLTFQCKR